MKGAFHMLPPEDFPVTLRFFRVSDGKKVWEERVGRPETLTSIYVPPLVAEHGPIEVEVEVASGARTRHRPDA